MNPDSLEALLFLATAVAGAGAAIATRFRLNSRLISQEAQIRKQQDDLSTASTQIHEALDHAAYLGVMLDSIPTPVFVKNVAGQVIDCNLAFAQFCHAEKEHIINNPDFINPVEQDREAAELIESRLLSGASKTLSCEVNVAQTDGSVSHVMVTRKIFSAGGLGRRSGILGIVVDLTERKQLEDELRVLAETDPLTTASNRRYFMAMSETEFARWRRYQRPFSVMLLDIDHFKKINDTYGHASGDEALKKLVATCREVVRKTDTIARMGGEEFCLMLPETGIDGAALLAERLREAVAQIVTPIEGGTFSFTASIGVSQVLPDDHNIEDVLYRADLLLYEAKNSGRNRVCSSKPSENT
jgi:diguanylate cyclase (GGDEF)-like protein/PAS domain S-box-containing protein